MQGGKKRRGEIDWRESPRPVKLRKRSAGSNRLQGKSALAINLFARATLDSLSAHIAILDDKGIILDTNRAWVHFAEDNGLPGYVFSRINYLKVCDEAKGEASDEAPEVAAGIRALIAGESDRFTLEYPCHSPTEKRWFNMSATRFSINDAIRIVVAHETITERRLAQDALKQSEEELRSLSLNLLKVQEKERSRLTQEIHDGVGQVLVAIKIGLENSLTSLESGHISDIKACLESLIPMARDSIREIKRICKGLRPKVLDDLGIVQAILWLCRRFESSHPNMQLKQEINAREEEIPQFLGTDLFRITQEALANAGRHSQATLVSVSLSKGDNKLVLRITDNGVGFEGSALWSEETRETGLGLSSMRARTELQGGLFSLLSAPGAGTTVLASWRI
jgi:two-component system, NarL family, sensor kinase